MTAGRNDGFVSGDQISALRGVGEGGDAADVADAGGEPAHAYAVCHREERSGVALSLLQETWLPPRDCHASLAMTVRLQ